MRGKYDILEKLIVCLCAALIIWGFAALHNRPADEDCTDPITAVEETDEIADEAVDTTVEDEPAQPAPQRRVVYYRGRSFRYSTAFKDRNEQHLAAAERIGLKQGPKNRAAAEQMSDKLREIHTNQYYVVEELTHSLPYLVPVAAARLDSIGKEFADILARNDLPAYRFRVTSVLRSEDDIRRLQRCNSNAISNSPHNYGTTFDIGYWHYDQMVQTTDSMTDDNLKLVLGQVLLNQQRAGHIYVKYEYKQCCFHITARN